MSTHAQITENTTEKWVPTSPHLALQPCFLQPSCYAVGGHMVFVSHTGGAWLPQHPDWLEGKTSGSQCLDGSHCWKGDCHEKGDSPKRRVVKAPSSLENRKMNFQRCQLAPSTMICHSISLNTDVRNPIAWKLADPSSLNPLKVKAQHFSVFYCLVVCIVLSCISFVYYNIFQFLVLH